MLEKENNYILLCHLLDFSYLKVKMNPYHYDNSIMRSKIWCIIEIKICSKHFNFLLQLLDCCPTAILSQIDMYLSKLILQTTSTLDSGFYICLAINDAGYTYREAYLNVQPMNSLVRAPGL